VRRRRTSYLWYPPILALTLVWIFPIAWTAITSLKPESELVKLSPSFAFSPTLDNYVTLFGDKHFGYFLRNSVLVAGGATIVSVVLGSVAAYALARSRIPGKEHIALWVLSLRMLPPISVIVPFYLMLNQAKLLDTYAGMLIVYLSFSLPFAIWMLQGFFSEVPRSIGEAAAADGAGSLKILARIIAPLSKAGIAVTTIFTFVFAWNEFLFAFLLTRTRWPTVPTRLGLTSTPFQTDYGFLTAGGIVALLPLVVIVFILQRQMVRGVTFGTVK
jgi:multiple sugar transport system permease protein